MFIIKNARLGGVNMPVRNASTGTRYFSGVRITRGGRVVGAGGGSGSSGG